MKEKDSDRLIDTSARQMVARDPSRGLASVVMASVLEVGAPAPRRFVWATAGAAAVLCGVIAVAVMSRTSAPTLQPTPPPPAVAQAPVVTAAAPVNPPAPASVRPPAPKAVARRSVRLPQPPPADFSTIEPLEMEPIVILEIDVPPIPREDVSIEVIDIEPLTIEPLAASND
jgi:hypothetical protein